MISLLIMPLLQRFQIVRYIVIFSLAIFYLIVTTSSSDYNTYHNFFIEACNGKLISGSIEPGFLIFSFIVGNIFGCNIGVNIVSVIFFIILFPLVYYFMSNYLKGKELFFIISILVFYLVTYQLAYNYRTGMASFFAIIAFLSFRKDFILSILFAFIAVSFHIQTLPVLLVFYLFKSNIKLKIFFIILSVVFGILLFKFLYLFVYAQGMAYLIKYNGTIRVAGLFYIFIYIACLMAIDKSKYFKEFKILIWFGLMVNIIFFFNSHISARILRPIEPFLMVILFDSLQIYFPRLSASIRYLISLLPGILFFIMDNLA
jgi:hypothetical protein